MKKTVAQWLEQLLEDVEVTLDRNLIESKPYNVWFYHLDGIEVNEYLMIYYYTLLSGIRALENMATGLGNKQTIAHLMTIDDQPYLVVKQLDHSNEPVPEALATRALSLFNETFVTSLEQNKSNADVLLDLPAFVELLRSVRESLFKNYIEG